MASKKKWIDKITVKVLNSPTEIFRDCPDIEVYIYEDCISYRFSGFVMKDDQQPERWFLEMATYDKATIADVAVVYHDGNNQFKIVIECFGASDAGELHLFVETLKEAEEIYDKLRAWKWGF